MKTIRPRIWIKTCMAQFERKILCGIKVGTIRPWPQVLPEIGDTIQLNKWSGLPYRSKQLRIASYFIKGVFPVLIHPDGMDVEIPGKNLRRSIISSNRKHRDTLNNVAIGDGFEDWPEMLTWFSNRYRLPFRGVWIYWGPIV